MQSSANVLGPYCIRCNTIHPTGATTPMIDNPELIAGTEKHPKVVGAVINPLPIPFVKPVDTSDAVL